MGELFSRIRERSRGTLDFAVPQVGLLGGFFFLVFRKLHVARKLSSPVRRLACIPKNVISSLSVVIASICMVGCASGVVEFQLYDRAFENQYEQAQFVLDRVARAERIVVRRRLSNTSAKSEFDPNKAGYYVDVGDPPITASIRASLKSLKDYNDALGGLANGETAKALVARGGTLAVALAGTVGTLNLAAGSAASVPGATLLVDRATVAVGQAVPIVNLVAVYASRESFRKQLIDAYPAMRDLMLALRDGTPAMYEILKRSYVQRASLDTPTGISPGDLAALEKDRELLAGWVLLIDKSLRAMQVAVVSTAPSGSSGALPALTEASLELQVLAAQVQDIRKKP
jgi:hypothetical protein